MTKISEMERLKRLLDTAHIPYEVTTSWAGYLQLWYPHSETPLANLTYVVCSPFTYVGKQGLLEMTGPLRQDKEYTVEGWLSGMEVYLRIADHYRKAHKEKG